MKILSSATVAFTLLGCLMLGGSAFAAHPAKKSYKHQVLFVVPAATNHFEAIGGLSIANLTANDSRLRVTNSETDKLVQTNDHNWDTFAAQLGASR